jgi:hypothetical protein
MLQHLVTVTNAVTINIGTTRMNHNSLSSHKNTQKISRSGYVLHFCSMSRFDNTDTHLLCNGGGGGSQKYKRKMSGETLLLRAVSGSKGLKWWAGVFTLQIDVYAEPYMHLTPILT